MIKSIIQKISIVIFICVLVYIPFLGVLYSLQHKIIYHPNPIKPDIANIQKEIADIREVNYSLPDGKQVYGWYLKSNKTPKVIVFFHGNTGNLEYNSKQLHFFKKLGYSVFMPEYQGFGGIKGNLRQSELEQDAKTALLWLLSKGYKPKDIIIYGHSLGTYVALFATSFMQSENKDVSAVILEAPFYSLINMGQNMFGNLIPLNWLLKDKFPSMELIKTIKTPIYIGHGKQDSVIPYEQGLMLFEDAKHPKTFFSSDTANHNTLPEEGFIDTILAPLK